MVLAWTGALAGRPHPLAACEMSANLAIILPFTNAQFFDLFGAYNAAFWPAVAALWVISLLIVVQFIRQRLNAGVIGGLMAVHWAWSGVAYHMAYFTRINPAAWLFGALFVGQAVLFVLALGRGQLRFDWRQDGRHMVAAAFLALSLLYPAAAMLTGHGWPRMPAFAVPCPTTLLTTGFLVAAVPSFPRWLLVVPVFWAVVGGSAAVLLGVVPDMTLFGAGVTLAILALRRRPSRGETPGKSLAGLRWHARVAAPHEPTRPVTGRPG